MQSIMKWFLVKYIYEIVCENGKYNLQFDEQLRLMMAENKQDALRKAACSAEHFQPSFENCKGEKISWKFVCIADLHEISAPGDGVEITSVLHEPNDLGSFMAEIDKQKAFLFEQVGIKEEYI